MSRFSTINSHHSALCDLERQRLERKMGQLRRELGDKGGDSGACTPTPGAAGGRRFQPPRRKVPVAPRTASRGSSARPFIRSQEANGEGAETPSTEVTADMQGGAPSAEMAWLLRACSRMEGEAEEVEEFLVQHDLGRYLPLLADDPSGLGSSLEALRLADEEALEGLGIPPSPRRRLLAALEAHGAVEAAVVASRGTAVGSRPSTSEARSIAEGGNVVKWGRLGKMPTGWSRTDLGSSGAESSAAAEGSRPNAPAMRVDCSCGEDEPLPPEEEVFLSAGQPEQAQAQAEIWTSPTETEGPTVPAEIECQTGGPAARTVTPVEAAEVAMLSVPSRPGSRPGTGSSRRNAPSRPGTGLASRPGTGGARSTAGSRPGTGRGQEKVICFDCFKQVYPQYAVRAATRLFCSEECAEKCRQALAAQSAREKELVQLRSAVLERGCKPASRPGTAPEAAAGFSAG